MRILHVDASVLGEGSVSRQVSDAVVRRLVASSPGADVTYRDLAAQPLGHLTAEHLAALGGAEPRPEIKADVEAGRAALEEFLAADTVVIGAPMYNFGLPTQLKAWIDRLAVAGKTFRYTETGPVGLAGGKRVIVAISRGGFYGVGTPNAAAEHVESYLRSVFALVGIPEIEVIAAEGVNLGPDHRERALRGAVETAQLLRAA